MDENQFWRLHDAVRDFSIELARRQDLQDMINEKENELAKYKNSVIEQAQRVFDSEKRLNLVLAELSKKE